MNMNCNEALDLLYLSYDGGLNPTQQAALEAHQRSCFRCIGTMRKAERLQTLLYQVPQLHVPVGLEERVIGKVLSAVGVAMPGVPKSRRLLNLALARPSVRLGFALAAAALIALAVFGRGFFVPRTQLAQPNETVKATIAGSVQIVAPHETSGRVAERAASISSGAVVSNVNPQRAVVAVTSYLAISLKRGAQVKFDRLKADPISGYVSRVELRLNRGTAWIRETLHHNTAAVRVATLQATIVPVGTYFGVTADAHSTRVLVSSGSVVVFVPGRTFNVLAGHGARILASGRIVREKLHLPIRL